MECYLQKQSLGSVHKCSNDRITYAKKCSLIRTSSFLKQVKNSSKVYIVYSNINLNLVGSSVVKHLCKVHSPSFCNLVAKL